MEGGAHLVSSFEFVAFVCGVIFVFLVLRKVWSFSTSPKGVVFTFKRHFDVDCVPEVWNLSWFGFMLIRYDVTLQFAVQNLHDHRFVS